MKTIVTHISPDLDAITAYWLIAKFLPGWKNSQVKFVPAGKTLDDQPVDKNQEIIHVDTGFGKFDHHQTHENTSATKLVFQYLIKNNLINGKLNKPLERIVDFVNETDHFKEVYFTDPTSDVYDFALHQLTHNLKSVVKEDTETVKTISILLDAALQQFRNKINAEEEIKKGLIIRNSFGKCLILESKNSETIKLGLKMGFSLVATKNPDRGNIRIKTAPEKKFDLTQAYQKILKYDKKGTWFFHISKNMLLNASGKNPNFIPSSLSIKKLIEILKEI